MSRREWDQFRWGLVYGCGLAATLFLGVLIWHVLG